MENEVQQETEQEEPQAEASPAAPAEKQAAEERAPEESQDSRPRRRGWGRRRVCFLCADKVPFVDYKDSNFLRRYISDRGRIETRRKMGTCAKHQRALARAIKRARHLALLPYTADHIRTAGVGLSR